MSSLILTPSTTGSLTRSLTCISPELTEKVQREASKIYDILGAKGLIRVDFIIEADGEPKMLEVNTTPGMTATSFIPQQVRAAGLISKDVSD